MVPERDMHAAHGVQREFYEERGLEVLVRSRRTRLHTGVGVLRKIIILDVPVGGGQEKRIKKGLLIGHVVEFGGKIDAREHEKETT